MTMASTKKEVIERYQKYNVSDYEVVDKVIDSADKDSEIIKKFDEIDSLSEEIGEKTISALSDYYDGIASFIKDLDKAVAKTKEEMTKRGVDKETVEKLDKLTEVYEKAQKGIENVSEVKKINRLAEKNLKDLAADLEKQKEIGDKIAEMKKNPSGVDQKDFFNLKIEQAQLEESINEKYDKKRNYNERLKDVTKDFSVVEYSETFSSDLVSTFKEFAKDSNVSKSDMQLFKGLIGYNNGKYEITYPGYEKVKDSIKTLDDLKEKQKRVDDLCEELGIDSPVRDALVKTETEEVKKVTTPEEVKDEEIKEENEETKEEETKDDEDKTKGDGSTGTPDDETKDDMDKMLDLGRLEPEEEKAPEIILPGMDREPTPPRKNNTNIDPRLDKEGNIRVSKNLDVHNYHGNEPTFKGHRNTMFEGKITTGYKPGVEYMDPDQKQQFYEEMGYAMMTDLEKQKELNEVSEEAKEKFAAKMLKIGKVSKEESDKVFDVLFNNYVIDNKGNLIITDWSDKNKKANIAAIAEGLTITEEEASLMYQKAMACLERENRKNVISVRVATAREKLKAGIKAFRYAISQKIDLTPKEETAEENSRSGR